MLSAWHHNTLPLQLTRLFFIAVALCAHRCGWGFDGAAVAWGCVQASSCIGLLLFTFYHNYMQDPAKRTWVGWSRECLTEWPLYIRVAIPSAVMICLDWWTFEVGADRGSTAGTRGPERVPKVFARPQRPKRPSRRGWF